MMPSTPSTDTGIGLVLRPQDVPQEERLEKWKPLFQGLVSTQLSQAAMERIYEVLAQSRLLSTRATYGAGLTVFHAFCDALGILERDRAPISTPLLLHFISCCAGVYSGSTAVNYVAAVKAWHQMHALPWRVDEGQVSAALSAADKMAPPASKRKKRAPVTVDFIEQVAKQLDNDNPLDVAVLACLTTVFWSVSRLGEFLPDGVEKFDLARGVKRRNVKLDMQDSRLPGAKVTVFDIPTTKAAPDGESVFWAAHEGPSDPHTALLQHFKVNNPGVDDHVFAWCPAKKGAKPRPLSKHTFMARVNKAAKAAGIPEIKGHGIRIGGVLEHLLRGVPFEVVKVMGRWASDAFQIYLRKHGAILTPYIQDKPVLEPFTRIAMPTMLR